MKPIMTSLLALSLAIGSLPGFATQPKCELGPTSDQTPDHTNGTFAVVIKDGHVVETVSMEEFAKGKFSDSLQWLRKRFPNPNEIWADGKYVAVVSTALGPWINSLSPAARSFVRNGVKIAGTYDKVAERARVGGTDYFYDVFNLVSVASKAAGGVVVIIGAGSAYEYLYPGDGGNTKRVEALVENSNYVLDSFGRSLVLAGQTLQNDNGKARPAVVPYDISTLVNETVTAAEYFNDHFDVMWFWDGLCENVPKVFITTKISGYWKHLKLTSRLNDLIFRATATLVGLPAGVLARNTAWSNANAMIGNGHFRTFAYPFAYGLGIVANLINHIAESYVMIPVARVIQDGVGLTMDNYGTPALSHVWETYLKIYWQFYGEPIWIYYVAPASGPAVNEAAN